MLQVCEQLLPVASMYTMQQASIQVSYWWDPCVRLVCCDWLAACLPSSVELIALCQSVQQSNHVVYDQDIWVGLSAMIRICEWVSATIRIFEWASQPNQDIWVGLSHVIWLTDYNFEWSNGHLSTPDQRSSQIITSPPNTDMTYLIDHISHKHWHYTPHWPHPSVDIDMTHPTDHTHTANTDMTHLIDHTLKTLTWHAWLTISLPNTDITLHWPHLSVDTDMTHLIDHPPTTNTDITSLHYHLSNLPQQGKVKEGDFSSTQTNTHTHTHTFYTPDCHSVPVKHTVVL